MSMRTPDPARPLKNRFSPDKFSRFFKSNRQSATARRSTLAPENLEERVLLAADTVAYDPLPDDDSNTPFEFAALDFVQGSSFVDNWDVLIDPANWTPIDGTPTVFGNVLFQTTLDTLAALAAGESVIGRLVAYQRSLLSCIGYLPQMERCLDCGQPPIVGPPTYFSSAAGGLICRDCEMHHVEKRAAPTSGGDGESGEGDAAWMHLYDYHLCCIAGRAFKTADLLFGILR